MISLPIEQKKNKRNGFVVSRILIAMAALAIVLLMLLVNYRIVSVAQQSLIMLIDNDLGFIAKNSALMRLIGGVSTEAGILINTFIRHENFDRQKKEKVFEDLRLIEVFLSNDEFAGARVSLHNYCTDVIVAVQQCERLNEVLLRIRNLDLKLQARLASLSAEIVEQQIEVLVDIDARPMFHQISSVLPACREYSQNLAHSIFKLNRVQVGDTVIDAVEKEKVLRIIDDFDTLLAELSISGAEMADVGRGMRRLLAAYKKEFFVYFADMQKLSPMLVAINESFNLAVNVSESIDVKIKARADAVKMRVEGSMSSFVVVSSLVFVLFNLISVGLCFYIVKVFKISQMAEKLQKALNEVRVLRGILPICAHCKSIRDDAGYWQRIETYLHERSDVDFSHGICPKCAAEFFPEFDLNKVDENQTNDSLK